MVTGQILDNPSPLSWIPFLVNRPNIRIEKILTTWIDLISLGVVSEKIPKTYLDKETILLVHVMIDISHFHSPLIPQTKNSYGLFYIIHGFSSNPRRPGSPFACVFL